MSGDDSFGDAQVLVSIGESTFLPIFRLQGTSQGIRFSTLEALCRELDCQPGDLLEHTASEPVEGSVAGADEASD